MCVCMYFSTCMTCYVGIYICVRMYVCISVHVVTYVPMSHMYCRKYVQDYVWV